MNSRGFSLIELMVSVAIIGIMASIAVPAYNRMAAKAKQTEAKVDLASVYVAEQAFHSEWQTYSTSFIILGLQPSGYLNYRYGFCQCLGDFATSTSNGLPTDYSGPTAGGATDNNSAWFCNVTVPGHCICGSECSATLGTPYSAISANTFTAEARAYIDGWSLADEWTMDEEKNIKNVQVGI